MGGANRCHGRNQVRANTGNVARSRPAVAVANQIDLAVHSRNGCNLRQQRFSAGNRAVECGHLSGVDVSTVAAEIFRHAVPVIHACNGIKPNMP